MADPANHAGDGPTDLAPSADLFGELNRSTLPTIDQAGEPDLARLNPGDLEVILDLVGSVRICPLVGEGLESGGKLVRLGQLSGGFCTAFLRQLRRLGLDVALRGQPGRQPLGHGPRCPQQGRAGHDLADHEVTEKSPRVRQDMLGSKDRTERSGSLPDGAAQPFVALGITLVE